MRKRKKRLLSKILRTIAMLLIAFVLVSFSANVILKTVYPLKYSEIVSSAALETGLSPSFIYAVIKTESNFNENAESSAGAKGLMQLMPETFEWIQTKRDGEAAYSEDSLSDPTINITYGTYLLAFLKDRYKDEGAYIAAYNAGIGNVDKWLSDKNYSQDGEILLNIPYDETKNYVEAINKAQKIYQKLYDIE